MAQTKVHNIRSDRINSILREIAKSKLPIDAIELQPSGKVIIRFHHVLDVAPLSRAATEAESAYERWKKQGSIQSKRTSKPSTS